MSVTVDVEARCRVALKAESWRRIEDIRDMIKRKLKNECNISHSTLEFEHEDRAHKNASLYGHISGWALGFRPRVLYSSDRAVAQKQAPQYPQPMRAERRQPGFPVQDRLREDRDQGLSGTNTLRL